MNLTPDDSIVFTLGSLGVNATIVTTWGIMALLTLVSALITLAMPGWSMRDRS